MQTSRHDIVVIKLLRYRVPFSHFRLNRQTGLLEMSRATFKLRDLPTLGRWFFKWAKVLRIIDVREEESDQVSINNLTIINFVLKTIGPTEEGALTNIILFIQVESLRCVICMVCGLVVVGEHVCTVYCVYC